MSKDLLNKYQHKRLSKDEVINLLGTPTHADSLKLDSLSKWTQDMGYRGWGFGLKFFYLHIEFEEEKSKRFTIVEYID